MVEVGLVVLFYACVQCELRDYEELAGYVHHVVGPFLTGWAVPELEFEELGRKDVGFVVGIVGGY